MLHWHQVTFSFSKIFAVLLLPLILSSCAIKTFVKKAPKDVPFVFKTNIKVEGNQSMSQKQEMVTRLQNQLDDSMKVRVRSYPLWQTIIKPPRFDTVALKRSESFMMALMNSLGYFSAKIRDTVSIDTEKKRGQQRVIVDF